MLSRQLIANLTSTSLPTSRLVSNVAVATASSSIHTSSTLLGQKQKSKKNQHDPVPLLHNSQLSPSPPPPNTYSNLTKSIVKGLAKLMGYNSLSSTAIRVTSDLYDQCAERAHVERQFWYGECGLPQTYQTWFQITNLHVYLLLIRFRDLPPAVSKVYTQELINHMFIDSESRMRDRFGIQTSRLVKGYMKDIHMQHLGSIVAYDEGLIGTDIQLTQAIWRNIWGAGWSTVTGVPTKLKGNDKETKPTTNTATTSTTNEDAGGAVLVIDQTISEKIVPIISDSPELVFPLLLVRISRFLRKESVRLAKLSDQQVMYPELGSKEQHVDTLTSFSKI